MLSRALVSLVLAAVCVSAHADPPARASSQERPITKLTFVPELRRPPVDVWLVRVTDGEGGLAIKLIARGVGPKPQSLTVYSGGGGDEGAGEADLRAITAKTFDLPSGVKAVRVDFTYQVPESKVREIATDTWLIGFQGKTHKLVDVLRTRLSRDRSKLCREHEDTELSAQLEAGEALLVTSTAQRVDAVYGNDDLPVDKTCKASGAVERKAYKLALEAPAKAPAPAASEKPAKPDGGTANSDD